MQGIVKKFYPTKGYGFITVKDQEGDIFFHYSEIQSEGYKTVSEGQNVEFTLDYNQRGKYAKGIIKL